jgi:hypothetical protein
VAVADEVRSRQPRADGAVEVDRHFDCLLCGPWVQRLVTDYTNIQQPPHRGMVIDLRDQPQGHVEYWWHEQGAGGE